MSFFLVRDSDDRPVIVKMGMRTYLNQVQIDNMDATKVTTVPSHPQGPAKYKVSYNQAEPLSSAADKWGWGRSQPCKRKGFCKGGRRTLQICKGFHTCTNAKCAYQKIGKKPNTSDFTRSKGKCMHCSSTSTHIECNARKYIENDRCHKAMVVIYVGIHSCPPPQAEKKPKKGDVEDYLQKRRTATTTQMRIDKVREALLGGKSGEVADIALEYSNPRHLEYIQTTVNKVKRPGGNDIEALRLLREDFRRRNLDDNLILEIGDNYMILSSEEKINLAALITLGIVKEPVSLDGCKSHAKDYTEIEMTTYNPVLQRNVKLVSMFSPKPGENSENIAKMVRCFDDTVNRALPPMATKHNLDPETFTNRGLDAASYVGDEGGALWSGLCKAKGNSVKDRTISDAYHIKQDITWHQKYFKEKADKDKFRKLMYEAYEAATYINADKAGEALTKLIENKAIDKKKNEQLQGMVVETEVKVADVVQM